ncbi:uncharacterized protein BDV17DRAFT_154897 [Aspergillus undulatus]|uniref:uncharacterized protein n=1 Tax=Aspergillus undulatus TaxID=1810928 RepID=UPI003CCD2ACA
MCWVPWPEASANCEGKKEELHSQVIWSPHAIIPCHRRCTFGGAEDGLNPANMHGSSLKPIIRGPTKPERPLGTGFRLRKLKTVVAPETNRVDPLKGPLGFDNSQIAIFPLRQWEARTVRTKNHEVFKPRSIYAIWRHPFPIAGTLPVRFSCSLSNNIEKKRCELRRCFVIKSQTPDDNP